MKIKENMLVNLIKESLSQNLLLERASDEKYDIISDVFLEALRNPKQFLYAHGRLDYKRNVFIKTSRKGSIEADLDPRYLESEYYKILSLVEKYYTSQLASSEKISWLEDIRGSFLNKTAKTVSSGKNNPKIKLSLKPLYAFTIDSSAVNTLALRLHTELDGFMKMGTILELLKNFKVIIYPSLTSAGGSMSASGSLNINGYHYQAMFQKNKPTVRASQLPPPRRTTNLSEATAMSSLIQQINLYGYAKVISVINWLYADDEAFIKFLETSDYLTVLISHEIGHYVNAIRAFEKTGEVVAARDSGLRDYKTATVGTSGYALSTEELQARYVELRTQIRADLKKIGDFNAVNDKNKPVKEKQIDFLNSVKILKGWNTEFYQKIISLLFKGEKSKTVNLIISGEKTTLPTIPGMPAPPAPITKSNFIKTTLFQAGGSFADESVWKTKKGKQYVGRAYNRVVDLVNLIDDFLKENDLK